jgi:hypothetical protein
MQIENLVQAGQKNVSALQAHLNQHSSVVKKTFQKNVSTDDLEVVAFGTGTISPSVVRHFSRLPRDTAKDALRSSHNICVK